MITSKEAREDLYNRMVRQIEETKWEIKRMEAIKNQKEFDYFIEDFEGRLALNKDIEIARAKIRLKNREENLKVLEEIIKNAINNSA